MIGDTEPDLDAQFAAFCEKRALLKLTAKKAHLKIRAQLIVDIKALNRGL